jgi:hypothetical protein
MVSWKRALYWILAGAGIALALLGLALLVRLSILSGSLHDLFSAPVALGLVAWNLAVEKPGIFLLGLGAALACAVASWIILRYLAQTDWERRHVTRFVVMGIGGALIGFGAVVVSVMASLP